MLLYLDTYDAAAIAGGMGEGHIPCGALYEMIRIVKPGNELVWISCQVLVMLPFWGATIKIFIIKDLYCDDTVVSWVSRIDYKYYLF